MNIYRLTLAVKSKLDCLFLRLLAVSLMFLLRFVICCATKPCICIYIYLQLKYISCVKVNYLFADTRHEFKYLQDAADRSIPDFSQKYIPRALSWEWNVWSAFSAAACVLVSWQLQWQIKLCPTNNFQRLTVETVAFLNACNLLGSCWARAPSLCRTLSSGRLLLRWWSFS